MGCGTRPETCVRRTLKHVLDEDRTLCDLLVDDKLLVIGGDEEDHVGRIR